MTVALRKFPKNTNISSDFCHLRRMHFLKAKYQSVRFSTITPALVCAKFQSRQKLKNSQIYRVRVSVAFLPKFLLIVHAIGCKVYLNYIFTTFILRQSESVNESYTWSCVQLHSSVNVCRAGRNE